MRPTQIIDAVIQEHVKPVLQAKLFRKKAHTFWRDNGEVIDVITIQKSQWNDSESASFAVNLGLYWKRVQQLLGQAVTVDPPREYNCTVRQRLGPLFSDGCDFWWKVSAAIDAADVGNDVVGKLLAHGIPWLEHGHDIERTLIYAESMNFVRQRDAVLALRREGQI